MRIPLWLGPFLALSTAALAQATYQMKTPYNEADFQQWAGPGNATLRGQGFLKTVGGDVKTCAGSPVYLTPANAYDQELIAANDAGVQDINIDRHALSFTRTGTCDAQGNFTFANVPAGNWYVGTKVTWQTPHIVQPGETAGPLASLILGIKPPPQFDVQGGELRKQVALVAGDSQVYLTGGDEVQYRTASSNASAPLPNRVTAPTAPFLGISIIPLPDKTATDFKLPSGHGLWILIVADNGAASRAGLKVGDVVLSANGSPWDTGAEMVRTMNSLKKTDMLSLEVWHSGEVRTVQVRF